MGTIVIQHLIVNGLGSHLGVQLTGTAVDAGAVVVKDTISDITALLHLRQQYAAADGMHSPERDIEYIARLHLMASQHIADSTVHHSETILQGGNLLLESHQHAGAGLGIDYIPHLRLTLLAMVAHGHLIVRVHLYAEVLMRINKLDQQGQLPPVLLHHGTTQHLLAHFIGKIVEFTACVGTIADYALPLRKRTNLPALAYWHIGRGQTLPLQEPATAPHHLA